MSNKQLPAELCKCGKVGKISCPNDERCGAVNEQLTTEESIKADAETYAGATFWVNQNPKGEEQLFYEYISSTSYVAGATALHERLEPILKAAEKVAKIFAHDGKDGKCAICELSRALQQWKGKEVENG